MDIVKKIKDIFKETFDSSNLDKFKEKSFADYFKQKWAELEKFIAKIIKVYEEKLEKIRNRRIIKLEQSAKIDEIMEINKKIVKLEEIHNRYFFSDEELEVFDSEDENYDFYDENDVDELNFTVKLPDDAEEILWEKLREFKTLLSKVEHCGKIDMQNKNIYLVDKETCNISIDQLRTEVLYIYLKVLLETLEKNPPKIIKKKIIKKIISKK